MEAHYVSRGLLHATRTPATEGSADHQTQAGGDDALAPVAGALLPHVLLHDAAAPGLRPLQRARRRRARQDLVPRREL